MSKGLIALMVILTSVFSVTFLLAQQKTSFEEYQAAKEQMYLFPTKCNRLRVKHYRLNRTTNDKAAVNKVKMELENTRLACVKVAVVWANYATQTLPLAMQEKRRSILIGNFCGKCTPL